MNIFVAGVHGVGKTYLASQLPRTLGLIHTSASKLIKEERALHSWGADKRVSDVDANQVALAEAVKRHNKAGTRLLLDGHFVLLDTQYEFLPLGTDVFKALNLDGVVLLEADAHTIAVRIRERDGQNMDFDHIVNFIAAERSQAQLVCDELGIPLIILEASSPDIFAAAVTAVVLKAGSK
ncbi:ATP-binding protein [Pseudomonas sp. St29]|uniref:ATP-binding protein n=1 Tax=Pseudomonas sp. St29 TaxID=1500687 RepID=UPI0005FCA6F1|nr:ATP-binding protein [Pseudomonas sp. St29]BAQ79890.1 adenylate kinase [Pseudomonas sp. St29]